MANNLKKYDANQVLRSVFDVERNTLRVSVIDGSTGDGSGFEVIITHTDDSIRLGDGSNFITSTTIGPKIGLDVNVINPIQVDLNTDHTGLLVFDGASAVPSGIETPVVSHTAQIGLRTFLQKISMSGDNVAKYFVKVNGNVVDLRRTMFGSDLNADFIFDGEMNAGYELFPGDVVLVTVLHNRPTAADFNGKIQYLEVT